MSFTAVDRIVSGMRRCSVCLPLLCWLPLLVALRLEPVQAAEIFTSKEIDPDSEDDNVVVQGRLVPGDARQFLDRTKHMKSATVLLQSEGGSLSAGITIGNAIRQRGFDTSVFPGHWCASACALAWLGGVKRFMWRDTQIGFHAAFTSDGRFRIESEIGNTLVTNYVKQLGLSQSAIQYITSTPPKEMKWLNARDAREKGIDVLLDF